MIKLFQQIPNFPFVRLRHLFLMISAVVVGGSILLLATRGLNFGTDFKGGVKLQYQLPREASEGEVRNALSGLNLEGVAAVRFGKPGEKKFVIKVARPQEGQEMLSTQITPELAKIFGAEGLVLEQEATVGPKVGSELRRKGILAVLVSMVCMLVYVGFRFDFQFAPGAILALFHDVLVVLGVFALLQLEFDLTILAACLTVVGYSINDTIVIFDRVREHARLISQETIEEVVNTSINETLSRTLLTSLTVFMTVVVLYFFGGSTIRDFAFALIVGVITGTWSTFTVACACYIAVYRWTPRWKAMLSKSA